MTSERKKLSKEELREDEFLEGIMSAVDYVRDHYQGFAAALALVVFSVLGIEYLISTQQQAREEAASRLSNALMLKEEGRDDEAVQAIQNLLEEKAGTPAAGQGTIALANHYFDQGDYDKARSFFQRYLSDYGDNPVLTYAAQSGLAAVLDAQGQTEAAAAAYRDIARAHAGKLEAALALWEAATCYGRLGDDQQRREVLEQIVKDHDQLPLAAKARRALAAE